MNKNKQMAIALVASTVLVSASTAFAVTKVTQRDIFIPSQEQCDQENGFVKTAAPRAGAYPDFTQVAERTINSVVSIKNYATSRQQQYQQFGDGIDPFEFFFGPGFGQQRKQQQRQQKSDAKPQLRGSGSGVIISTDGYIVTNNHVVDGAEKLTVTLNNNDEYNARVIGSDPNTDIALIKIVPEKGKTLDPIEFGNSDNVKVGEWAVAVGNPFGFNSSVTAGIISAKGRSVNEGGNVGIKSFIQHDAAVNPGNSGGALVDTNGDLIGINTMIYSQTGNYAGISFAVPSNIVKKIVTDLKQYGAVQRAVLGISYEELNAEKAKEHKITATKEGIYVAKVSDESAAQEAGLQEGDVIVKLNGNDVKNSGEMQEQMSKLRPGDKASISFYRNNKIKTATVTFKNDQGTTKITKSSDFTSLGCAFMSLSAKDKEELGVKNGVKVTGLKDGKFKRSGIRNGLVITAINDQAVDSSDDVEEIYSDIMRAKDADKVMVIKGFYETGRKVYIAVNIADDEDE